MSDYNIDRESPIPAYYQVATDIKNRIILEEWEPDSQIPSEKEFASQYNLSRVTIRQALAELEKDGIIKRFRGKGAFINKNPNQFTHELKYSLVSGNYEPDSSQSMKAQILDLLRIDNPYGSVAEALLLSPGESTVYFKRLFYLDNKPIAIGKSWLPASLVPGLEEEGLINNSLSQTVNERYHLNVEKIDDVLETVRSTQNERKLLEATYDTPLILIRGISYLDNGKPLEYSNTFWLGDRVRFRFFFQKNGGQFKMHTQNSE